MVGCKQRLVERYSAVSVCVCSAEEEGERKKRVWCGAVSLAFAGVEKAEHSAAVERESRKVWLGSGR